MEKLYKLGKTRSIGVSNWTILGLESLLRVAEIKPAVNQVEIHPFLPNTSLISYFTSHGILPVAYSPLGSQLQVAYTGETVMGNEVLKGIAGNRGVSVAQILISWGLKRGYAVLPMSGSEERIKKNFQVVELSDEEFEDINNISKGINHRFVNLKETFGFDVWAEDE
jgi:diketogulonate reductase-like aldo/keto reductase